MEALKASLGKSKGAAAPASGRPQREPAQLGRAARTQAGPPDPTKGQKGGAEKESSQALIHRYDGAVMAGYSAQEVAAMLGLPPARLRAYVRSGLLSEEQGEHGRRRFSFQDLLLLRTAEGLVAERIPPRRVVQALKKLREHLDRERGGASTWTPATPEPRRSAR